MKESAEVLVAEIRGRVELLESSLPARVDAKVSPESKLPFKPLLYRASLIWKMGELSRDAYEKFENKRLASAILLTRARLSRQAQAFGIFQQRLNPHSKHALWATSTITS